MEGRGTRVLKFNLHFDCCCLNLETLQVNSSKDCTMYQRKVDVDMLNAVKNVLADVVSISPSSKETFLYILDCRSGIFVSHQSKWHFDK